MRIKFIIVICLLVDSFVFAQNVKEVEDARILSFENTVAPVKAGKGSSIDLSKEHYKYETTSLEWKWNKEGAQIRILEPIDYLTENPNPKETSVSTFVFWVYAKKPMEGSLRFEFLKDGRLCSWFDYNITFEGWRGAWVAFDRDMKGKPEEGMNELVITASSGKGELFLDHLILSSFQDIRHHTADFQAPFINAKTTSHWLILLKSWGNEMDIPVENTLTKSQISELKIVEDRLAELLLGNKTPMSINKIRNQFNEYAITENKDGTIKGKTIHFTRHAETYIGLGHKDVSKLYGKNKQLLRQYNDFMYNVAIAYNHAEDEGTKKDLADMYILLTRHILDQGFAAGSAQGTIHHLGYSMRNYYTAPILMREVLEQAGLDEAVQQGMEWFSGVGEVKLKPAIKGMDIDAFNTSLIGRIASIIMLSDSPEKVAYLKSFSRWVDNGYKVTEGLGACFKSDGTVFHHRHHYPAYAIGGFDGAVYAITLLNNTDFAVSQESHNVLKKALLEMRFYCNQNSFPLALSGRHPDGKGKLIPMHYSALAMAGSPDGSQKIDTELAAAYMRLTPNKDAKYKLFKEASIEAEQHPQGTKMYGYNSSLSHRRDDWLLTVAGHSRYLWSAEIYLKANHYGRYLTHGSLQLLGGGDPVSSFNSGFRQEGWDWCHIPGTTAAVRPMTEMKANILNVDVVSGYEEMLMSDQAFAGGVSHKGQHGAYAMKLQEHDKYNGSLSANKSFFIFDNRVVALGTDIENNLKECPAHTTLFQNYIGEEFKPLLVNNEIVNSLPYKKTMKNGGVVVDNLDNAYFVSKGELIVKCEMQNSLHEESDKPTQNEFAAAYINHGDIVENGQYEYLMVIKASNKEVEKYKKALPYRVKSVMSKAHIVYDIPTKITGYALFEAGKIDDDLISEVSHPVMIMASSDDKLMTISLSDPDLRFYEGESDEKFDENGKRIERSIYSRDWIDNPSKESSVGVTIVGKWEIVGKTDFCTANVIGDKTFLTFKCREGASREVQLVKQ